MIALTIALIAVVVIVACMAALLADRLLDAAVGGSFVLVQKALCRRGHRLFWLALGGAVILAAGVTVAALMANAW